MIGSRGNPCRRHRPTLMDLVDHGERSAETPAALDHLAVCHACAQELTEIALTVAALRRTGSEVRAAPVPVIHETDVRRLAAPRRTSWSWRLQLGSLLTGAAIAAVVVAPWVRVGSQLHVNVEAAASQPAFTSTWLAAEARLAARPDQPSVQDLGTLPPRYPDGLFRPWKEVLPTDATPREFEPS